MPSEQLEQECCLVVEPARGVEQRLVGGVERPQLVGEQVERGVPGDRLVVVRAGPLDHGLGEPALVVEPLVRLLGQLGDGVLPEEVGGDPARGRLVVDVLGAVLAVLVHVPVLRIGPRATGAVDSFRLVDVQQRQHRPARRGLAQRVLQGVRHGGHTGRPGLRRDDREFVLARTFDLVHDVATPRVRRRHSPAGGGPETPPLIQRLPPARGSQRSSGDLVIGAVYLATTERLGLDPACSASPSGRGSDKPVHRSDRYRRSLDPGRRGGFPRPWHRPATGQPCLAPEFVGVKHKSPIVVARRLRRRGRNRADRAQPNSGSVPHRKPGRDATDLRQLPREVVVRLPNEREIRWARVRFHIREAATAASTTAGVLPRQTWSRCGC